MDAMSLDLKNIAVDPSSSNLLFQDAFYWDWYIRLRVRITVSTGADLSINLDEISTEFQDLWQEIKSRSGQEEGQLWPGALVDSSTEYFWLVGIPSLPSPELSKCRQFLREWQKETIQKMKGKVKSLEAKFIPRKVFLEHRFEVYTPTKPEAVEPKSKASDPQPVKNKKEKNSDASQVPERFKKIKGSNPQEVRRQFLEHNMKVSGSSSSNLNAAVPEKLRPGREVLKRMKFDSKYNTADFVVGYIDRKAGILEKSVDEWGDYGQEELMAYIKNVKDDVIVWDKARKIDLIFGKKGG